MRQITKNIAKKFTDIELAVILEAARTALKDTKTSGCIKGKSGVCEDEMIELREKLQDFMNSSDSDIEFEGYLRIDGNWN